MRKKQPCSLCVRELHHCGAFSTSERPGKARNCFFPSGRACGTEQGKAPGNLGLKKKKKNSIPAGCQARCCLLVSSLSTTHAAGVRAALFVSKRKGQGMVFYTLHCEPVNGSAVHNARGLFGACSPHPAATTTPNSLINPGRRGGCRCSVVGLAQPCAAQSGHRSCVQLQKMG